MKSTVILFVLMFGIRFAAASQSSETRAVVGPQNAIYWGVTQSDNNILLAGQLSTITNQGDLLITACDTNLNTLWSRQYLSAMDGVLLEHCSVGGGKSVVATQSKTASQNSSLAIIDSTGSFLYGVALPPSNGIITDICVALDNFIFVLYQVSDTSYVTKFDLELGVVWSKSLYLYGRLNFPKGTCDTLGNLFFIAHNTGDTGNHICALLDTSGTLIWQKAFHVNLRDPFLFVWRNGYGIASTTINNGYEYPCVLTLDNNGSPIFSEYYFNPNASNYVSNIQVVGDTALILCGDSNPNQSNPIYYPALTEIPLLGNLNIEQIIHSYQSWTGHGFNDIASLNQKTYVIGNDIANSNSFFLSTDSIESGCYTTTTILQNSPLPLTQDSVSISLNQSSNLFYPNYWSSTTSTTTFMQICAVGISGREEQDVNPLVTPNPSAEYILIRGKFRPYTFVIYNNLGQFVMCGSRQPTESIDIRNLVPGVYFITIQDYEEPTYHLQFVKSDQ
jgi:hypothetical protein